MVASPFSFIMRSDRSGGMVESPLTFKAGRYWIIERCSLSLSALHSVAVCYDLCELAEVTSFGLRSELGDGPVAGFEVRT